ncbi:hypothetical protein THERMOT_14 [Bathymodiolus thermophilus thioautotrophic gill symbiont]|nr:hypothetical protein THERMOT_14 [Bathymodiolus thermophilus thioautotrophic gill symbiont]
MRSALQQAHIIDWIATGKEEMEVIDFAEI